MQRGSTGPIPANVFKSVLKRKPHRKVAVSDIVSERSASRTTFYTKGLGVRKLNVEQREYFEFHMAGGFRLFLSWFDRDMPENEGNLIETLKRICPDYIKVTFSGGVSADEASKLLDRLYASDREYR